MPEQAGGRASWKTRDRARLEPLANLAHSSVVWARWTMGGLPADSEQLNRAFLERQDAADGPTALGVICPGHKRAQRRTRNSNLDATKDTNRGWGTAGIGRHVGHLLP